jgi:hypothetical protein
MAGIMAAGIPAIIPATLYLQSAIMAILSLCCDIARYVPCCLIDNRGVNLLLNSLYLN